MPEYKVPGVYVEENSNLPPIIYSQFMSVPVFIGYTEKSIKTEADDLLNVAQEINSLSEFEQYFGKAKPETNSISIEFTGAVAKAFIEDELRSKYVMYYSLQLFFANGGGKCFIVSIGNYETGNNIDVNKLLSGLDITKEIDSVGLILFPDAINLASEIDYYFLFTQAIKQAAVLKYRFVLLDVYENKVNGNNWQANISALRNNLNGGSAELKYAAVYFPQIYTNIAFDYEQNEVEEESSAYIRILNADATNLFDLQTINSSQYTEGKRAVEELEMLLPVTPAVAGVYAQTEVNKGLWKAAANINIEKALSVKYLISDSQQMDLNVDADTGKSINVIRKFTGKGNAIIWGGRTLAGNDNEWRYISVQRYVAMLEKSIKIGIAPFIFEPNEATTWIKIKATIQNFLKEQWRLGALAGAKPEHAFFVNVGLQISMTTQDILENRIIIECGVAPVRAAEFIIFRLQLASLPDE